MIDNDMYCRTCKFADNCAWGTDQDPYYCCEHDHEFYKPKDFVTNWFNSFDSSSATECFTAVNQLKEALIRNDR